MRVAVMQPYFFPYAGYFALLAAVDRLVIFDSAQYLRRGWIHRNRLANAQGAAVWFRAPVHKMPQKTAIYEVTIRNEVPWKDAVRDRITPYRHRAPYFESTAQLLESCLAPVFDRLLAFNLHSLQEIMGFLGISCEVQLASEHALDPGTMDDPQARMLEILSRAEASQCVNLPGGRSLYDAEAFKRRGIGLSFVTAPFTADVPHTGCASLSIIHQLMWQSREQLARQLRAVVLT